MNVLKFLKENVTPATGCTEPIAVGYAVALAYQALYQDSIEFQEDGIVQFHNPVPVFDSNQLIKLDVEVDRNVYKNALHVAIPGSKGQKGLEISAAMGFFLDPRQRLNLFESSPPNINSKTREIIKQNKIKIKKLEDKGFKPNLNIHVSLKYLIEGTMKTSQVILQDEHDKVSLIQIDESILYSRKIHDQNAKSLQGDKEIGQEQKEIIPESIEKLIEIVKNISDEEKEEIYKGILMNKKVAETALKGDYGLNFGKTLRSIFKDVGCENTLICQVKIQVAMAGDVRMSGARVPVMTTGGSGNHGIMAVIPVSVIGKMKDISKDKICEAALLAHFITKLTDKYAGHLSALCGCAIKAGIAASAAIAYLMGGTSEQVNNAINIMSANNTGFICDGAKESCALKLSTAAGVATESAFLALKGVKVPDDNGIIFNSAEDTLKAIGRVSFSMAPTDIEITNIIEDKERIKENS